jgi:hypothetical protein
MQESAIANIAYSTPVKSDIAVGFALFNYTGSSRIIMNYLYTIEKMKLAGIPVFTIELVIKGSTPCIEDAFHVYGSSYLFLKENLFRILETKIPEQYTKLLFIDSDVIFDNPDWYNMLSEVLETSDICHCFQRAIWLDITYKKMSMVADSYIKSAEKDTLLWNPLNGDVGYHSGFGWAFTRKWYNQAGFIDEAVIGSGDILFSYGLFGEKYGGIQDMSFYDSIIDRWTETIGTPIITYLPVTIFHLFHGSLVKRQYLSRNEIFSGITDINDMLVKNEDGVFELTDRSYNNKLYAYFDERKDDFIE